MLNQIRRLWKDEEGATLLEYTILLAIIVVAVITFITAIGGWINTQWSNLNSALVAP